MLVAGLFFRLLSGFFCTRVSTSLVSTSWQLSRNDGRTLPLAHEMRLVGCRAKTRDTSPPPSSFASSSRSPLWAVLKEGSPVYLGVKYFRSLSWSLPLLHPSLAMEGALGDASVLQEAADPPLGTTLHLVAL